MQALYEILAIQPHGGMAPVPGKGQGIAQGQLPCGGGDGFYTP